MPRGIKAHDPDEDQESRRSKHLEQVADSHRQAELDRRDAYAQAQAQAAKRGLRAAE